MSPDAVPRLPLEPFRVVATEDAEEMRHALLATFGGAQTFDLLDRGIPFAGRGHDCALGHSGISYCGYTAPVRLTFDETPFVRQQFCIARSGRTRLGRTDLLSTPRSSCTIPAEMASQIDFAAGYEQLVVRFNVEALARKLEALLGGKTSRVLRFEPFADAANADIERLRRVVFFLAEELDLAGDARTHPGLVELEQLMMLNFLFASRHTYRDPLERKPADAAPWQVRRAEEYIAANLERPITIEGIAAATGASVRSIFKLFRATRGYSPMAFAKLRRLEHAQRALQTPNAATTVTGVALLYGFHNQGHFARDYRERFGELPSATLRRSRGGVS